MKRMSLVFLVLLTVTCIGGGCGDDGNDGTGTPGTMALGNGPWEPETCSPAAQQRQGQIPAGCTQAQIDEYYDCMNTACEDTLRTCYGAQFRAGVYGGSCADFIECAVDCQCSDSDCTSECPGAQACGDCFNEHPCGQECSIPTCAFAGTGLDASRTCADLQACCNSLVGDRRMSCERLLSTARMSPNGTADFQCSFSLSLSASVGFDTPQCAP